MRLGRTWVGFLCFLFAFGLLRAASAEVSSAPQRIVVGVPDARTGLAAEDLAAALRTQLSELGVEVVLSSAPFGSDETQPPAAVDERALAFVWLVREGETLSVQFFEAAGATLRQRRLPLAAADSASLEEVALVVRSAVSALLEREVVQQPEEAPADSAPTETSSESPSVVSTPPQPKEGGGNRPLLSLDAGWTGQSYAEQMSFSHGAHLGLRVRPTKSAWSLGTSYALFPAQSVSRDGVEIAIARHPVDVFVAMEMRQRQTPFFVGAQLGVCADLVRRTTTATGAGYAPTSATTRVNWAIAPRLLAGWSLSDRLALLAVGGADVVLERVEGVLPDGDAVVSPHRLRPRVLGLISWDVP